MCLRFLRVTSPPVKHDDFGKSATRLSTGYAVEGFYTFAYTNKPKFLPATKQQAVRQSGKSRFGLWGQVCPAPYAPRFGS